QHSLRANAISLCVGYLTMPIGAVAIYTIGPLWSGVAIFLSVLTEGWYLSYWVEQPFRWRPVVVGNLISSAVLMSLPYLALDIKLARPEWAWQLDPYQDDLWWGSVVGSALLFVVSFAPLRTRDTPSLASPAIDAVGSVSESSRPPQVTPSAEV
ncbi:MAG: hypothetical protein N2039_02270, partial [Gemmataceae bacterium]|nr:hypothetical protein [Gemmataceae bacterium]